jgi:hypothetical protein
MAGSFVVGEVPGVATEGDDERVRVRVQATQIENVQ